MTIPFFYLCLFKLFLGFVLCMLLTVFASAFLQKAVSGKNAFFYFLGLVCLAVYYFMWVLGRVSLFYFQLDLPLLFDFILLLGMFLVYKEVKGLFSK